MNSSIPILVAAHGAFSVADVSRRTQVWVSLVWRRNRRAFAEHLSDPSRVRILQLEQHRHFALDVVFHAPNRDLIVVKKYVGGPGIAVV
jgi:hypothetical protein